MKFRISCCAVASPAAVSSGIADNRVLERREIRLGLPSKGRMATDTLDLLKVNCILPQLILKIESRSHDQRFFLDSHFAFFTTKF